jgi:hypothetical protein
MLARVKHKFSNMSGYSVLGAWYKPGSGLATKILYSDHKILLSRRHKDIRYWHKSNSRSCSINFISIRIISYLSVALETWQKTLLVKCVQQWVSSDTSHFKG